jgi:hypothetical protein
VADQIDVRNLDALRDARAAVMEYRETAQAALGEAIAEADRSVRYVTQDLRARWEQERRSQERRLNHLKTELARAELQSQGQGGMVSTREERANVERCQAAIETANRKLARIRQWSAVLERELGMFRGQSQVLGRHVEGDLKRAEAELSIAVDQLEEYLRPADARPDPRAAPRAPGDPRGPGDDAAPDSPGAPPR